MSELDDLADAKERVESEYNDYITVYDYGNHIRVTNGSAAMYIDIRIDGEHFKLKGEKYGEQLESTTKRYTGELLDRLSGMI